MLGFGGGEEGPGHRFVQPARGSGAAAAGIGAILAPMPGKVIALDVAEGDSVPAGQRLMVLEAMKMENVLKAPKAGRIKKVPICEGMTVEVGQPLVAFE